MNQISQQCAKCPQRIDRRRPGALCTQCQVKHQAAQAHLRTSRYAKPRQFV